MKKIWAVIVCIFAITLDIVLIPLKLLAYIGMFVLCTIVSIHDGYSFKESVKRVFNVLVIEVYKELPEQLMATYKEIYSLIVD